MPSFSSPEWTRRRVGGASPSWRRRKLSHSSSRRNSSSLDATSTSEEEIVKAMQLQWFRCRHKIFKDTTTNLWRMRYERNGQPVPQAERTFMHWRAQNFAMLVRKSALAILLVTMLALGYDFMQDSEEVWLRVRVRTACACLTVGLIMFIHSSYWYHRHCPRVLLAFSFLYACLIISYTITLKDISYGIHIVFMFWVLNYHPVPALDGMLVALLCNLGKSVHRCQPDTHIAICERQAHRFYHPLLGFRLLGCPLECHLLHRHLQEG